MDQKHDAAIKEAPLDWREWLLQPFPSLGRGLPVGPIRRSALERIRQEPGQHFHHVRLHSQASPQPQGDQGDAETVYLVLLPETAATLSDLLKALLPFRAPDVKEAQAAAMAARRGQEPHDQESLDQEPLDPEVLEACLETLKGELILLRASAQALSEALLQTLKPGGSAPSGGEA